MNKPTRAPLYPVSEPCLMASNSSSPNSPEKELPLQSLSTMVPVDEEERLYRKFINGHWYLYKRHTYQFVLVCQFTYCIVRSNRTPGVLYFQTGLAWGSISMFIYFYLLCLYLWSTVQFTLITLIIIIKLCKSV